MDIYYTGMYSIFLNLNKYTDLQYALLVGKWEYKLKNQRVTYSYSSIGGG